MTDAGRNVLVLVSLGFAVLLLLRAGRSPPPIGPPAPAPRCAVPVERVGEGVACLDEQGAAAEGLAAGDRVGPGGARTHVSPARMLLFEVPLDVNRATSEELESLPGIGPGLAARIVAARPFSSPGGVRAVPGIGARRFEAIRPRLLLLPPPPPPPPDAGAGAGP